MGTGVVLNGRLYTVGCGANISDNRVLEYDLKLLSRETVADNFLRATADAGINLKGLEYRKESEHFILYCSINDNESKKFLNELPVSFEKNSIRIANDLKFPAKDKITVYIWPTLGEFHIAMGQPDAPGWFTGTIGNNKIYTVSPVGLNGLSIENVILHEYTHVVILTINTGVVPRWLSEGLASYEGKEMDIYAINEKSGVGIPTLLDLSDWAKDFVGMNGYQFSYSVVDFIVKEYGYEKLSQFIRKPSEYQRIFDIDSKGFEAKWNEFLKKNY